VNDRFASALAAALVGFFASSTTTAFAADTPAGDQIALQQSVSKGIDFLRLKGQSDNGTYSAQMGPGITALATMAVLKHGRGVDDPQVVKALKYLESCVQNDGSISTPKPGTTNYDTSICLACFALANKDGRYKKIIDDADKFLKGAQRDEGEGRTIANADYGGVGYSAKGSGGDLSNTAMMLDALQAAGDGPDDPAVQRALVFVSRCQNRESEFNTLAFAAKINDGGFYYSPVGEGASAAGKGEQGALRSYASMTYAGLKSMLYAGVTADDPRVKAATRWLQTNYSVEENPGLGTAGLYYYYQLMAKALDAVGASTFEDSSNTKHDWRAELSAAIIKRQSADGSWVNDNNRWHEGDPNLATSFALLALAYCRPAK
jgi:squalene-hopene/tetraprenyl-beta-curcumene cyclase